MSGWRKFTDFLGLRRNTTLLLVALLFAGTGEQLWIGFVPKYLDPFILATFVVFTLFPLSLLWANNFAGLAAAFVVRGLKEFGEPARKALIIAQARPELRSRTFGAYYFIRDCIVTSGSFLGAWLWSVNPRANFIGAALVGLAGTLWFWWFVHRSPSEAGRRRTEEQPKIYRSSFYSNHANNSQASQRL